MKAEEGAAVITGLKADCEYEVSIFRTKNPEIRSDVRKFRTGFYPGKIVNYLHMLRNNNNLPSENNYGKAVLLKIDAGNPEKKPEFFKIIDFNGGTTKFVVDRDEKTGLYYSVINRVTDPSAMGQRNILALIVSKDLIHWRIVKDIIDASDEAPEEVGLQYTDNIVRGEDLLFVSRTAYNHAGNFHDSNCITFHREENFRQYF